MKKISLVTFFIMLLTTVSIYSADSNQVATVLSLQGSISVQHQNGKTWDKGYENMPLCLNDVLKTDKGSYADVNFVIGGQVGVNENTTIQITGSRQVNNVGQETFIQKVIINAGEIWAKITKQQQEIQFQTKGGVIAIKGTEFVIEETPQGEKTVVSLMEGQIAYYDANNKETLYNGGDEITIPWKNVPVVKHYVSGELKKKLENKFIKLRKFFSYLMKANPELAIKIKSYLAKVKKMDNSDEKAQAIMKKINGRLSEKQKEELKALLTFPYKLSPSKENIQSLVPTFSWSNVEKATSYWLFLSEDDNMNTLIWDKKTDSNSVTYPQDAQPLEKGKKYFWRVMALGDKDNPLGPASQTYFTINK